MRDQFRALLDTRMRHPQAIAETAARRRRRTSLLGEDEQAEAHDWPEDLFAERTWYVPRSGPEPAALVVDGRGWPGKADLRARGARLRRSSNSANFNRRQAYIHSAMTFQSSTPQAFKNVHTASTVGSLRRSRRRKSCTVLGGKPVRRERARTGGSPARSSPAAGSP